MTIAMGTEEMLIDIGSKGSDSVTKIEEYEMKTTAAPGTYYEGLVEGTSSAYSENIQTSYEFGFTLGGEDGFGLTNDNSYDVAISAVNTTFSDDSGYITEEIYRDYSDDVGDEITTKGDDLPEKIHRKTETFYTTGEKTVDVIFEVNLGADSDDHRSAEEILADYEARKTQIYHLQAMMEITDDPAQREHLQNQINMHTQVLAEITEEATSAGISSDALAEADAAAEAAAAQMDASWTEGEDDDSVGAAWAAGFFTEGQYFHFLTNPSEMEEGWPQNGQYLAIGVGGTAVGLAIGLKAVAAYGIAQIGTVALSNLPAQAMIEYQLLCGSAITMTGTVAAHGNRPYQHSRQFVAMIVRSAPGRTDPGGLSNALRYDVPGWFLRARA